MGIHGIYDESEEYAEEMGLGRSSTESHRRVYKGKELEGIAEILQDSNCSLSK